MHNTSYIPISLFCNLYSTRSFIYIFFLIRVFSWKASSTVWESDFMTGQPTRFALPLPLYRYIFILPAPPHGHLMWSSTCVKSIYTEHFMVTRRYFQHAHFIPIVGVGKKGEY